MLGGVGGLLSGVRGLNRRGEGELVPRGTGEEANWAACETSMGPNLVMIFMTSGEVLQVMSRLFRLAYTRSVISLCILGDRGGLGIGERLTCSTSSIVPRWRAFNGWLTGRFLVCFGRRHSLVRTDGHTCTPRTNVRVSESTIVKYRLPRTKQIFGPRYVTPDFRRPRGAAGRGSIACSHERRGEPACMRAQPQRHEHTDKAPTVRIKSVLFGYLGYN